MIEIKLPDVPQDGYTLEFYDVVGGLTIVHRVWVYDLETDHWTCWSRYYLQPAKTLTRDGGIPKWKFEVENIFFGFEEAFWSASEALEALVGSLSKELKRQSVQLSRGRSGLRKIKAKLARVKAKEEKGLNRAK